MPRFDFHCAACRREFERTVSGAPATIHCPYCGEKTAARLFRPQAIQFNIPAHFRLKHVTAGWHLPRDPETGKVDYSNLCRPGEIKPPPPDDGLERWLKQDLPPSVQRDLGLEPEREKITLSTGSTDGAG